MLFEIGNTNDLIFKRLKWDSDVAATSQVYIRLFASIFDSVFVQTLINGSLRLQIFVKTDIFESQAILT